MIYILRKFQLTPQQIINGVWSYYNIIIWNKRKRGPITPAPLMLMIEPTNRCNFKCPLCDRGSGKLSREVGEMTYSQFKNIIDQAGRNLKAIYLWNQGEPLLNKQLPEFIEYAVRKRIFTVISTNGSMLERIATRLLKASPDEIIVSLDGASEESYKKYRRGGDFSKIIKGVQYLSQLRGRNIRPLISLQFLLLKHNIDELNRLNQLLDITGADRVLLKTVQVSSSREAGEYLPLERRLSRYNDYRELKLRRRRGGCYRIFYSAVINWNGDMTPCCFDKDANFTLGNVFIEGLRTIWQGEKFNSFRRAVISGRGPKMCNNCTEGLERLYIS